MIKIVFFAQLRERLECEQIQWDYVQGITAAHLKSQLSAQGGNWLALEESDVLCAINHEISALETIINDNDEVAFFPPVTGG
ncbi:MoaD/ThiS family protein [Alteromonadaceae bacterium BrNp21-10]|nr:MoaD/ThiS family protein [Alteromonadaceae bacterium BrNp21-10]